ncbi:family 43 glycosylhydrolase [Natrinema salaciae]|uniref:Arabinan endo-1,5-alpha-L-arabinosidase n=1 Tax=Natrinema salaciae TaxID=1186196 RepID=A0A1H9CEX7_9EURY|nr:family 43 glycosylhydrolase [Natrinema salaciae]SEP99790.1 arabinan endo-1,5-alpha-L-arabinosidase [Natrinema salaciae]
MRNSGVAVGRREVLRWGCSGAVAIAGPVCIAGATDGDERGDRDGNPTESVGFGDVSVLRTSDAYYAYGTTPDGAVSVVRSDELVDWTTVGSALAARPDWRDESGAGVRAPSVARYDGTYHLYYAYSTGGSRAESGIALATASDPAGPFTDRGPVFRAAELGVTGAVGGELAVVDDTPYMVWGSRDGIYGVELTPDGTDPVPGTTVRIASERAGRPTILEANGYYYLWCSTGPHDGADGASGVAIGRSKSVLGPYENRRGADRREPDADRADAAVLRDTDAFGGPGHGATIRDDDGDWWLLYDAVAAGEPAERVLAIDPIRWDDEGWPVVGDDGTPSTE